MGRISADKDKRASNAENQGCCSVFPFGFLIRAHPPYPRPSASYSGYVRYTYGETVLVASDSVMLPRSQGWPSTRCTKRQVPWLLVNLKCSL